MSALAWLLLERGHPVTGSDLRGGSACTALQAMGARVYVGHAAGHVDGADLVAASTAIAADNPEIAQARALGIPLLARAELLASLLETSRGLLITGTHGKTTTTSMATVCLQQAGLDPSFAIGGTLHDSGTGAHHGTGEVFVAEADESDRSFLAFAPDCAVVTNVEYDHHDVYDSLSEVHRAFEQFLARREVGTPAIVCADDLGAMQVAADAADPVRTYGQDPAADLRVRQVELARTGSRFRLASRGRDLGTFWLGLPGLHNVLNAAAAAAAAEWAGAGPEAIRDGLAGFQGAGRRFQRVGEVGGVTVIDDYGHHPTEVTATLAAARQLEPAGRLVVIFQPHRYSRTAALAEPLGVALADADVAIVTDVYGAGESPVPGVTGRLVADAGAEAGGDVRFAASTAELPQVVGRLLERGDLVVTLGAGDITEVGPALLRTLGGGQR
jgi:UDP-N-acetylmuramate--alanine ligase